MAYGRSSRAKKVTNEACVRGRHLIKFGCYSVRQIALISRLADSGYERERSRAHPFSILLPSRLTSVTRTWETRFECFGV